MEVVEHMPCDARSTLDALRGERALRAASEAREFALAAHFCDLFGEVDGDVRALPGAERLVQLGSDGTPGVAEFCVHEFSAAMGMRPEAARVLMANALDVRHRLPQLWRLVMAGTVPVWQARRIASATMPLDAHHAGLVDLQVARSIVAMSFSRVEALVDGLVLQHLPVEVAEAKRLAALDSRGVWVEQSDGGVASVGAVLDAPDAILLDAQVDRLAGILAAGGVTGGRDARRARALGILANPAAALDLVQASLLDELPADPDETEAMCFRAGMTGHTCGAVAASVDPEKLLPRVVANVHLTEQTLADGAGPLRLEEARPTLAEWAREMFGTHRVVVRPVIDQNHQVPSDAYECPPTMREAVELRNPFEVFPWSTRRSKGLDLDHTIPWSGKLGDRGSGSGAASVGAAAEPFDRLRTGPVEARLCWDSDAAAEPLDKLGDRGSGSGAASVGAAAEPFDRLRTGPVEAPPPRGVTHPMNLGPLTRGVHRAKTHGGWQLQQPLPGYFLGQSPLGFRYLVTPSRTLDLGCPDAPPGARIPLPASAAA